MELDLNFDEEDLATPQRRTEASSGEEAHAYAAKQCPPKTESQPRNSPALSRAIMAWREDIVAQLRQRDLREKEPFAEMMAAHHALAERSDALQAENRQLQFTCERLKIDGGDGAVAEVGELKAKLLKLQEELTDLHRRKGENAQTVIDLGAAVKAAERELGEKTAMLLRAEQEAEAARAAAERTRADMGELEATNQLLKDEYQTLQLTLSSAERKLIETKKENERLVAQVIDMKERDVARMNAENDHFLMQQQETVSRQLAEAAKEQKIVVERPRAGQTIGTENLDNLICAVVRLPNRAYHRFDAHDSEVNAVRWSPHGNLVATAGADRKIKLWDVSKGGHEGRGVLTGANGAVMSLDYDASGNLLLASSSDFACRVWSLDDMRLRHTLTGHGAKILSAKFMGDNTRVCSGSHDKTLKVWDLRSRACVSTFFPGSNCHDLVCLDTQIISGHFDRRLRFYDVRTGARPTQEIALEGRVTSCDLARNGQQLLACSRDDRLTVLDLRAAGAPQSVFAADGFHVGFDYTRAAFSPDSDYVAAGSGDGAVFIWKVDGPARPARVLREHAEGVICVAWQPAGNGVMSCDRAKEVIIWADM